MVMTMSRVYKVWKRPGDDARYLRHAEAGRTNTEIAKIMGVSRQTVQKHAKRLGRLKLSYISEIDRSMIESLSSQGKNDAEISEYLGINYAVVHYNRRAMGLPSRYTPVPPKKGVDCE